MLKENKTRLIQLALFLVTIITTTIAGSEWMHSKYLFFVDEAHIMSWNDFLNGFQFSIPFLLILSCHEFGHYFTARYHKVDVTLPFYIPLWLGFILSPSFGTMGAFIRIKDRISSTLHYFDIGIAGPLAGFVVAIGVIAYGYSHLPNPEYIYEIHPEYEQFGLDYADHVYTYEFSKQQHYESYLESRKSDSVVFSAEGKPAAEWGYPDFEPMESYPNMYFSKPLLFQFVETYLVSDKSRIPNEQEIMHNPYLLAGLLALFFTALNLLPIGQLDGGHVIFGLFGAKRAKKISQILFTVFVFYAGLGIVDVSLMEDTTAGGLASFLILLVAYMYFLNLCAFSMFENRKDRWTFAAVMLAAQFGVHTLFGISGYEGWLLFAIVLGRFIGIYHPPVRDDQPLSLSRQILGILALIIFIISFSPKPFVMEF
ncbi:MAG: site-2 protease family protein [Cyclobacteriaceae bacterium]|uniref:site-2 protease family protein n=1 Tax=Nonlabens ulvanivorans TaxID=906888 RepID=UPI003294E13A